MLRLVFIAAFIGLTAEAPVSAASEFDGQWTGGAPPSRISPTKNCPPTIATVTVANGRMTGKSDTGTVSFPLNATVAPDGSVTGRLGVDQMSGKFTGNHFSGTVQSSYCGTTRPIELNRTK